MKKHILFIAFMVGIGYAFAQQVTNVQVVKTGDNAIITYDLSGDKPDQTFNIKIECLVGNGKLIPITSSISGDINDVSVGSGKKIEFHALNDLKMFVGDNFMFQLKATEIIKPKPIEVKPDSTNKVETKTKADEIENVVMNIAEVEEENSDKEDDPIFIIVEEPATFQGGDLNSFRSWVEKNLEYPEIAAKNGAQGKVYIQFVVNKNGEVVKVKVLRNVDPALDNESIRVISSSPKWTPAKQGGKNVNQQFVIPLSFVLTDNEGDEEHEPDSVKTNVENKEATTIQNEEKTKDVVIEQSATFQGGDLNTFRIWVEKNLEYPAIAAKNGVQGKVYVQFIVNSNGEVAEVKILRGVDPALDKESIRVISSSPKWTPAKQDGKNVAQQFVIPLSFALQ